jgi:hypothetical protein
MTEALIVSTARTPIGKVSLLKISTRRHHVSPGFFHFIKGAA